MIPGPYSIVHCTPIENEDCLNLRTLKWGYDTAVQAYSALSSVAAAAKVAAKECTVIRDIQADEAAAFAM